MNFTTDYDKNYADALQIASEYMQKIDYFGSKARKEYADNMLAHYAEIRNKAEDERNLYLDTFEDNDKPLDERFEQYDERFKAAEDYKDELDNLFYELNKVYEILQNLAYCAMEYADNNNKLNMGH